MLSTFAPLNCKLREASLGTARQTLRCAQGDSVGANLTIQINLLRHGSNELDSS